MGRNFSKLSSHIMAFDNAVQDMYRDKVTPDAGGQYWGAPQVIHLRKKCTGTPVIHTYVYPTSFKIEGSHQYNTLAHCRVQLAVQRISRSAPTHRQVINLFDIQSPSQESRDDRDDHAPPLLIISVITRRESRHATSVTLSNATASARRKRRMPTTIIWNTTMRRIMSTMPSSFSFVT